MKRSILFSILLFLGMGLYAQDSIEAPTRNNFAVSFTPQYIITGGMRMDFDGRLTDKTWLTLAPTFYYMDNSYMWDPESTSYLGVGLHANYRYFPSGRGIYVGLGMSYKFLNAEYTKYSEEAKEKAEFHTMGFDYLFGYQFKLVEQLFMDLYLGWGFRYSIENSNEADDYWSNAILDLGYSGFLPVAGVRVGFEF